MMIAQVSQCSVQENKENFEVSIRTGFGLVQPLGCCLGFLVSSPMCKKKKNTGFSTSQNE